MKYYNPFNCPHVGKFYAKTGLVPLVVLLPSGVKMCGGFTPEHQNWKYCCECPNLLKSDIPEPDFSNFDTSVFKPLGYKGGVKGSMKGEYYEMSQKKFN